MEIDVIVYLLDTCNGAFGTYRTTGFLDECGDLDTYWWEEGNGSCDCNRSLFLYERPDEEGYHLRCNSGENRIKILSIVAVGQAEGECLWEGDYIG